MKYPVHNNNDNLTIRHTTSYQLNQIDLIQTVIKINVVGFNYYFLVLININRNPWARQINGLSVISMIENMKYLWANVYTVKALRVKLL